MITKKQVLGVVMDRVVGVVYLLVAETQYYPQNHDCLCLTLLIRWSHASQNPLPIKKTFTGREEKSRMFLFNFGIIMQTLAIRVSK